MVTVTLDEITLNAVKAALDERVKRLERETNHLETWQREARGSEFTEDGQRALVWNIAALHETKLAREIVGDAEVVPEPTPQSYDDWTPGELVAGFGK